MPTPQRREYTDSDRVDALDMLEACNGNVARAAKRAGVPESILRYWRDGGGIDPLEMALESGGGDCRRPIPPARLFDIEYPDETFAPAPEVWNWMKALFILDGAPLENEEHAHLKNAKIGVYWTAVSNVSKMKQVAGQAGIPFTQGDSWAKKRYRWHLHNNFGFDPDFIITLDANICVELPLPNFCCLCEHELLHCAQAVDAFGGPRFRKDTGDPVYSIRDHDVTAFFSSTRRYSVDAAEAGVSELVKIAGQRPEFTIEKIELACGCGARL